LKKHISDKQVVDAILSQDNTAVNACMQFLYADHFPTIKHFVLKNNGTNEEANDVFQDALVIFYVKIRKGEYLSTSSLKTYLFGISKNLWLKELRKKRTEAKHMTVGDEPGFQEELIIQESQMTIRKVMEHINEECKRLLIDFYYNGQSMSELTVKYGLGSEAATKNKKYRCLQKLINLVKRQKLGKSDFSNE